MRCSWSVTATMKYTITITIKHSGKNIRYIYYCKIENFLDPSRIYLNLYRNITGEDASLNIFVCTST